MKELTEKEIECYKKAGNIAAECKNYARKIIKPGMKLIDIATKIDEKIKELGGELGFPIDLSQKGTAAHFTPTLDCEETAQGLLQVDIGVAIEGYIADTAITLDLTENKEHKKHLELNKKCLKTIMEKINYESEIQDIGNTIGPIIKKFNEENNTKYSLIHGLSGHAIAKNTIHAGLTMPNYPNTINIPLAEKAIAIEPFISTGTGNIHEGKGGGIYAIKKDTKPRDQNARKIIEYIKKEYKTRPFCERWIEKAGFQKVRYTLKILEQQGIIHHYPELIETSKGLVSHFENTFIFTKGKKIITTYEEGWEEKNLIKKE